MLTANLKPKPCGHCGSTFTPARPMQAVCSAICASRLVKAKNTQERAQFKERKAKLKRIPDLIKEAQTAFNAFIRERDHDQPCICCGRPLGTGDIGGGYDCGHYRSTGSAPHLRFDERNAHGQTKFCNRWGAGRAVDYRIGLITRIGLDAVVSLEAENKVHKWDRDELIAIKALYVSKLRELKRSRG